jgi:thiamine pyrophosphokinase
VLQLRNTKYMPDTCRGKMLFNSIALTCDDRYKDLTCIGVTGGRIDQLHQLICYLGRITVGIDSSNQKVRPCSMLLQIVPVYLSQLPINLGL